MCLWINDASVSVSRLLDFTDYTAQQQSVQSRLQIRIKHIAAAVTLRGMQAERTPGESSVTAAAERKAQGMFDKTLISDHTSRMKCDRSTHAQNYAHTDLPDMM